MKRKFREVREPVDKDRRQQCSYYQNLKDFDMIGPSEYHWFSWYDEVEGQRIETRLDYSQSKWDTRKKSYVFASVLKRIRGGPCRRSWLSEGCRRLFRLFFKQSSLLGGSTSEARFPSYPACFVRRPDCAPHTSGGHGLRATSAKTGLPITRPQRNFRFDLFSFLQKVQNTLKPYFLCFTCVFNLP